MSEGLWGALLTGPLLVLTSWIIHAVTRAGARGGLGPNSAIGIRLPSTMRSEAAWVAGHRAALEISRLVGWFGAACGILLTATALLPQDEGLHQVSLTLFGIGYGFVLGGAIWCGVVASRAARAVSD